MTAAQLCDKVAGAPVAHSEEQRTFNPRVRRSKLRGGTTRLTVDQLPEKMRARVRLELCPVRDLDPFCWIWTGTHLPRGYGLFSHRGKSQLTHRLSYTLLIGPIPDGLQIDHLCRVHPCLNPAHLEPVTNLENALRSDRATRTHCIRNHPLSGDNLIVKKPGDRGRRACRTCNRAKTAESTARRRQRLVVERLAQLKADRAKIRRILRGAA